MSDENCARRPNNLLLFRNRDLLDNNLRSFDARLCRI